MSLIFNIDSYNKSTDKPIGLKCKSCGFIGNDLHNHYCGKCGQPLQFFYLFPTKWNNDGKYYELEPILDYRRPIPLEWEVVRKDSLDRYLKLQELILKEEREGNSIFRTKKQFLKELLSIIAV